MSLRTKFVVYLAAVHVVFGAAVAYAFRTDPTLILALEAVLALSLAAGVTLVRGLLTPIERVRDGARFLADSDFTSRFRPTGDAETDQLIDVYNRMADHLREERTRNQEQNYFLEKVLAASPVGLVTLDFDGRVASVSPGAERLLGLTADRAAGRRLEELDDANATALASVRRGESHVVALSGNRLVKCSRGEFLDRGFAREFLTLAELTEEIRQSEKAAYEKLIRMMSHEVNNTVAASASILRSCLAFHETTPDGDDYVLGLRAVIERTDRLNEFMRGFADVVRIPDPKLAPCDVRSVVSHTTRLMAPVAARHGVTLTTDLGVDPGPVACDRIQIEQVFVNVLKNAIEAAGEGGAVTVRTARDGGRPALVFENTGAPIPPDVRARLFTPFFTTKENGQGIGLTVTQEILTRHGFPFSLESPAGGPTRFTIVMAR